MKFAIRIAAALGAVAALAAAAAAAPVTYAFNKVHTEVGFEVRHFFAKVHGRFNDFDGTIVYDDANPSNIAVDGTVQTKSVWTNNENRDADLRSPHFFAADSFPTLHFRSTRVEPAGKDKYRITGDLTMRGVTHPVTFDAEYMGAGTVGTNGGSPVVKAGFSATATVNRKDWGISWNKVLDNGSLMLGDDVTILLNVEADKAPDKPKP